MQTEEQKRFRSFAERYVIERASTFRKGSEDEDGWDALQRAKSLYKQIDRMSVTMNPPEPVMQEGAASPNYGPYIPGQMNRRPPASPHVGHYDPLRDCVWDGKQWIPAQMYVQVLGTAKSGK